MGRLTRRPGLRRMLREGTHMARKNPMQPIVFDADGAPRFKRNAIVRALLDHGRRTDFDLDRIAEMEFTQDDRCQFAQLIGYGLSSYLELEYVAGQHAAGAALVAARRPAGSRRPTTPRGPFPRRT